MTGLRVPATGCKPGGVELTSYTCIPDREFAVASKPNQTFTFTIDNPGKIGIELHHLDKTVATVEVTP